MTRKELEWLVVFWKYAFYTLLISLIITLIAVGLTAPKCLAAEIGSTPCEQCHYTEKVVEQRMPAIKGWKYEVSMDGETWYDIRKKVGTGSWKYLRKTREEDNEIK